MTLLPSLLQPIHSNAITQYKGQKCPSTSKKKTKSNDWHESECEDKFSHAMSKEFNALLRNGTQNLVQVDESQNIIECKWGLRNMRKHDSSINRYKARLIVKGFHQRLRIDYHDTFSPIAKPTSVQLFLSLVVTKVLQLDVNNGHLSSQAP